MSHEGKFDVYCGLDVGEGEHHGTALTPTGKKTFDRVNDAADFRPLSR